MAEPPDGGFDPTPSMDAEILLPLLLRQVSPEERACLTLAYAAGRSHPESSRSPAWPWEPSSRTFSAAGKNCSNG